MIFAAIFGVILYLSVSISLIQEHVGPLIITGFDVCALWINLFFGCVVLWFGRRD